MSFIFPSSSKNALFVLRLVWRRTNARQLSTAALAREAEADGEPASSVDMDKRNVPLSSTTITVQDPNSSSSKAELFLEDESMEYTTATSTLPERSFHPLPIPWPTLFPHHHHNDSLSQSPPKICDPLYRLVASRQYVDAQKIYVELLSHKIRIQHRHEYLSAAIRSFDQGQFRNFLLWLEIYPNRPATSNHPGLKAIWNPIIDRLLKKKKNDYDFIEQFLLVVSKKGLLPAILPPLIPHLTFNLSPIRSRDIIEQSLLAYNQSTTSTGSTSRNAIIAQSIVNDQISKTWKSYLLKLVVAGWKEDALSLYEQPPANVTWDEFTHCICSEELYHNEDLPTSLPTSTSDTLPSQLRAALHDLPTPSHLASLLRRFSSENIQHDHPTLLDRFKSRFCNPPKTAKNRSTPTIMSRLWVHAEIINLQHEGLHDDALRHSERTFHWTGLPSHPLHRSDIDYEQNLPRAYPNIQLITTLLPSLLVLLPSPHSESVPAFYAAYLENIFGTDAKTIPSLRPTSATHNIFLRAIAHHSGPDAALRMLSRANSCSNEGVGEEGYAAVLLSFAGRRRLEEMYELLSEAENSLPNGIGRRTYKGLVAVLVKTGKGEDAEKIYMRAVEKLGVEAEDLLDDLVVT